ncbi:PAAR domain-containing protein [Massilia sp. S19_KUP03_FR1]|uniref:PAAR domain-containing protein n=1 Tax=Massilia sp. S19_KUP03_FR1 TaxID=3025503 RepID=UPI002FCD8946
MSGPLIRLGDKTSHGGVVIEASPHSDIGGIGIARMGDKTVCPIKGHGSTPIISGDSTLIVDGKPAARAGDKTACGATLIAGQQTTIDNI